MIRFRFWRSCWIRLRSLGGAGRNPCMSFFERNKKNPKVVSALINCGEGDAWAHLKASPFSPGLVHGKEALERHIVQPHHWDESTQWLKPGFYDDLATRGLSVNRTMYKSVEDVMVGGFSREADSPNRKYIGVLQFFANEIVKIIKSVDGLSGAVFDTALKDDVSHADVCYTKGGRKEWRFARSVLFESFKDGIMRYDGMK